VSYGKGLTNIAVQCYDRPLAESKQDRIRSKSMWNDHLPEANLAISLNAVYLNACNYISVEGSHAGKSATSRAERGNSLQSYLISHLLHSGINDP
jgi:hypothetical protein